MRRPSRCDVRCRFGPFQLAASISTRVVVGCTSERWPPMMPAIDVGPSSSQISSTSESSVRSTSSSVVHLLAVARAADDEMAAGDEVPVERVQRLAGEQHHVVGDVDDVVDRALAGGHQARLQPRAATGAIVTSSNSRAVKRGHRSGASTSMLHALDVARACPDRRATAAGSAARRSRRAPRARRRRSTGSPAGWSVISSSSTSVAIGSTSASGVPGSRSSSSTMIPLWSVPMRDLVLGQDHARRTRRRAASRASAACRRASPRPGSATPTVWPAATFGAPQTICATSPSPIDDRADATAGRRPGAARASSTRPTTKLSSAVTPCVKHAVDLGAGHRPGARPA